MPKSSEQITSQRDGTFYAKGGEVWKAPIHRKNADGSTTITIGFPVCRMSDAVGDEAAASVAALMNSGTKALQRGFVKPEEEIPPPRYGHPDDRAGSSR